MKTFIISFALSLTVVVAGVIGTGCAQQAPGCQVSAAFSYAATYKQKTPDDGSPCSGLGGDVVGFGSYNPSKADRTPDLSKSSLAIRTLTLGDLYANAKDNDVVDTTAGDEPFAFGAFKQAFPDPDDLCTPGDLTPAHQVLAAIADDVKDPEDPDDDIVGQPATDLTEEWSDVKVYVTAAAEGTEVKGHYKITDNTAGCSAEYDTLSVFPAVSCEDDVPTGDALEIASIEEADPLPDGTRPVEVKTTAAHGLAVGDLVAVSGVDDDEGAITYDSTYTVATVVDDTTFITKELDPYGDPATEPDAKVESTGTVQKLVPTPNPVMCSPVAVPNDPSCGTPDAKDICAAGSGINGDFPIKCDPDLFLCVLDADPSSATFPVLAKK